MNNYSKEKAAKAAAVVAAVVLVVMVVKGCWSSKDSIVVPDIPEKRVVLYLSDDDHVGVRSFECELPDLSWRSLRKVAAVLEDDDTTSSYDVQYRIDELDHVSRDDVSPEELAKAVANELRVGLNPKRIASEVYEEMTSRCDNCGSHGSQPGARDFISMIYRYNERAIDDVWTGMHKDTSLDEAVIEWLRRETKSEPDPTEVQPEPEVSDPEDHPFVDEGPAVVMKVDG